MSTTNDHPIDVTALLDRTRDALSVRQVFGDPIAHDGTQFIPVARIRGGAGGGEGDAPGQNGHGSGGGFGVVSSPAGVFVLKSGTACWKPAVNVERIVLASLALAAFAFWSVRSTIKAAGRR